MVGGNDHSDVDHDADLFADLEATADDLRAVFVRDPAPEVAARHLAAMGSAGLAPVVPLASRRRRVAVAAMVGAAGVVFTGGLAAAGALPGPVQDGVARLVQPIGIDLPDSGEHPGRSDQAPGHGGTNPGKADEAPGQQDQPGNSENAPGLGGENPGRSDTAPGQTGDGGNNKPAVPPGQVDNPGQNPGNGQGTGQGNGQGQGSGQGSGGNGGPPSSVPGKGTPGVPPTSVPGKAKGR